MSLTVPITLRGAAMTVFAATVLRRKILRMLPLGISPADRKRV